jgi:hypothetical protein
MHIGVKITIVYKITVASYTQVNIPSSRSLTPNGVGDYAHRSSNHYRLQNNGCIIYPSQYPFLA